MLAWICGSDRWNRGHAWNRPIVLVGHSPGCVVTEQLVVALNRRAESFGSLKDDIEVYGAKVSRAFLASLSGCFFYAPPYTGLVPSEDLLKFVFGGLTYSPTLFHDLCLTSPKLKELSQLFMEARSDGVQLMALTEGFHTRGAARRKQHFFTYRTDMQCTSVGLLEKVDPSGTNEVFIAVHLATLPDHRCIMGRQCLEHLQCRLGKQSL